MVEAGGGHDEARLEALARHWHLSDRQRRRLEEAICRWERSDLRREALSYELVQPEVPFFIKVDSRYGSYVEGAIDLLCRNRSTKEVLVVDYKTGDVGLTLDEIAARHEMQANFYAHVMMAQGSEAVECAFVCVECDRGDGQPVVVRYAFDEANPPRI
jgi:ATP-dependent exoDNAse (exonuclease V) beta subunit